MEYGPVVNFLAHHSYGPGGKNVQDAYEAWQSQQRPNALTRHF
jgi:hypothetical protein